VKSGHGIKNMKKWKGGSLMDDKCDVCCGSKRVATIFRHVYQPRPVFTRESLKWHLALICGSCTIKLNNDGKVGVV
jgi:hypothetical protein